MQLGLLFLDVSSFACQLCRLDFDRTGDGRGIIRRGLVVLNPERSPKRLKPTIRILPDDLLHLILRCENCISVDYTLSPCCRRFVEIQYLQHFLLQLRRGQRHLARGTSDPAVCLRNRILILSTLLSAFQTTVNLKLLTVDIEDQPYCA